MKVKVIALRGEPNCGKTETLNIVRQKMLQQESQSVERMFQDLGNNDFLAILEFKRTKIGIVSQGDYDRSHGEAISVKKHLEDLKSKGAQIAICACTTGPTKNNIQKAIDRYEDSEYIDKQKSTVGQEKQDNEAFAKQIMDRLEQLITNLP